MLTGKDAGYDTTEWSLEEHYISEDSFQPGESWEGARHLSPINLIEW